jgi:serine/threonine protein kinase
VKRDGPMEPDEAAAICLQAASGLAYSHAMGVVHRDIKPQNILLSTKGVAKILDMGLARMTDEAADDHTALTQEGAIMGTIDYMPPEQGIDTHAADERADIYSLGATLYYLLAGHPPFPKGTALEKLRRLATEEPQPLGQIRPEFPQALTDIVTRAMAKQPEDRFATMEDMVRALQPLAAAEIAGRPAMTSAVQAAANTHRAGSSAHTFETSPVFAISDDGPVHSMARKQQSGPEAAEWLGSSRVARARGSSEVRLRQPC